ncbi:allantoate deiminase [Shouchella lehensis]|uniref:Allantoate amidohydrolase n=1 Tax=Shouchella lehensis G1 TaxID=1246626 RepID=A0A060M2I3_9BACI|nr:allantoate deiminase [Shouchella lehensis]AIC94304.1 allantoate amidohydrolase [Shouchella lehensis G1]
MDTGQLTVSLTTMIEDLAKIGQTDDGGVTRLLYTDEWFQAQQTIKNWFGERGLTPFFDDIGNVYGRVEGTNKEEPVVLTGSHIDTVVNGGKYDGAYGVLASLVAVSELVKEHGQPKRTIDVISFCEEEGSRFPLNFWGSGKLTGIHEGKDYHNVQDIEGKSFLDAMHGKGFGLGHFQEPLRQDLACFVELHIEQGAILEDAGESLGIVKSIVGQRRFIFTVTGESNHAGTTPMNKRKDAMNIASQLVHKLIQTGHEMDEHFVATVGQMTVTPNTPNVIPGKVTFTLDIRHHRSATLDVYHKQLNTFVDELSGSDVAISVQQYSDVIPVDMEESLQAIAHDYAQHQQLSYRYMYSGAGHDAQILGAKVPTCLLFVPSVKGISHSPYEFTNENDLHVGVKALKHIIYQLAYN